MKINKWTVGLAAVGLVSLPSVLQAEEKQQMSPIQTAAASTVISGYVNTAVRWVPGTGNAHPPGYIYNDPNKQDNFSLDVVDLTIEKPLDEAKWAAGYRADLWFGQDANTFGTQSPISIGASDFAIRQAYVALRTPVGNGLDFKIGAFDSVIGYESHDAGKNPNYSRSYGTSIEPHTHTGLLASYQFSDMISAKAGIADTYGPIINENSNQQPVDQTAESFKTYMGSVALTAPQDTGFLAGSTLYAGFVNGFNSSLPVGTTGGNHIETSYYVGATVATPIKELRVGGAFDYANIHDAGFAENFALYASYQATEKLSLHLRGEYFRSTDDTTIDGPGTSQASVFGFPHLPSKATEITGTVQYDLWKNVISRLEFRWDHSATGDNAFSGTFTDGVAGPPSRVNSYSLMANIIYMF